MSEREFQGIVRGFLKSENFTLTVFFTTRLFCFIYQRLYPFLHDLFWLLIGFINSSDHIVCFSQKLFMNLMLQARSKSDERETLIAFDIITKYDIRERQKIKRASTCLPGVWRSWLEKKSDGANGLLWLNAFPATWDRKGCLTVKIPATNNSFVFRQWKTRSACPSQSSRASTQSSARSCKRQDNTHISSKPPLKEADEELDPLFPPCALARTARFARLFIESQWPLMTYTGHCLLRHNVNCSHCRKWEIHGFAAIKHLQRCVLTFIKCRGRFIVW